MSDFSESYPGQSVLNPISLPISSIVRAVCEAASQGPEQLYEVMMKMSLMVEATAPTYGLSIWAAPLSGKPSLRWAEGLEGDEIALAEAVLNGPSFETLRSVQPREG